MSDEPTRAPRGQRFFIGSDHAGYELKQQLRDYLIAQGNEVADLVGEVVGRTDYPVAGEKVARRVAADSGSYGVLVCGTGVGITIAANKVKGVRAALLYNDAAAEYARRHNNANVLVFGGRTMGLDEARRRIEVFFGWDFEGGRHQRRNDLIAGIEGREG